jgi:hypothetical protein
VGTLAREGGHFGPAAPRRGGEGGPGARTLSENDMAYIVEWLRWNGANGIGLRVIDIRADIARGLGIDVSESTIRAVLKGPLGHSRTKRDSRCYRRWTPENIEYDKISFHLRRRFDLFRRYYALRLRQAICRNGSWRRSTARDSPRAAGQPQGTAWAARPAPRGPGQVQGLQRSPGFQGSDA